MNQIQQLDLFSGIGGFRLATEQAANALKIPFNSVGFSEIDRFATQSYKTFFDTSSEVEIGDIVSFCEDTKRIEALPNFNLLTGGFPCQPFSMMGAKKGFDDSRGGMFFEILKIIDIKKPGVVLLENVKNLKTHDSGKTISRICSLLESHGYSTVTHDVFNTSAFGLPQTRNRVYILAVHETLPNVDINKDTILAHYNAIERKSVNTYKTVLDILEQSVSEKYYLSAKIKPTILAHGSGNFVSKSEINQAIARPLTATMVKMHRACQDNYYSDTYIKSNGAKNDSHLPANTLAKRRIRKITPREAFMLQGFPNNYARIASNDGLSNHQLYKQSGNAVSVNVVYAIIHYILSTLNK